MKQLSALRKFSLSSKGFTLIELLIVIAVIGVLAAAVLVAIDPVEQLSRGRDSGRKNSVASIGRALETYYTANSALPAAAGFDTTLTNSGELKTFPTNPGGNLAAVACTAPAGGGAQVAGGIYCYKFNGPDFVVYTHMESKTEQRKGTCGGVVGSTWYVFSSTAGRAGTVCQAGEPAFNFNGTFN